MLFLWLSSQCFQQLLVLMQKVLPLFSLFGIWLAVYRCWQVASRIFYSAKALFHCMICTKREDVFLTGARSSLDPSATVVCLQVSSLCISGWVLFLNKGFIRQWILVNIYFFCFFFCFLCPSFTVTHGSVLSNYPWMQWAGMDLHLLVKSEGLIKHDSISAVTFPWCHPCFLLYPHWDSVFTMCWCLLLLWNNVKVVLTRFWMLQL